MEFTIRLFKFRYKQKIYPEKSLFPPFIHEHIIHVFIFIYFVLLNQTAFLNKSLSTTSL